MKKIKIKKKRGIPMLLTVGNNGPELRSTNYFDTEHAEKGFLFLSVNAGAWRLLVPDNRLSWLADMRTAKEVIVSRGHWYEQGKKDAYEVLFEDYSDSPFIVTIGCDQADRLVPAADADVIGQPPRSKMLVYTRTGKVLELACRYRAVEKLPCMKPWGERG